MKKIVPILVLSAGLVLTGCNAIVKDNNQSNLTNNLEIFKNYVNDYSNLNETNLSKEKLAKYKLAVSSPIDDNFVNNDANTSENINDATINDDAENNLLLQNQTENKVDINENNENNEKFSTLYSLTNDIEESCDEFCELKQKINNAIVETQNLISKIQNDQLTLTREERLLLTEQSYQLKNLGKQLSNVTTELSFNLSDINDILKQNGKDIDALSMKYLVVLDNLVNGNEMLTNGLNSLNLMNQMINLKDANYIEPNNYNHIVYGFRQNNQPPVIKDYILNENGEWVENKANQENSTETETSSENTTSEESEEKINIDSYKDNKLTPNINTYGNYNLPRNIDSFYNTAYLNNGMYGGMYGNRFGGYGYNYPANQYNGYNTPYGYNNLNNTPNIENNQTNNSAEKKNKKFKLTKNIDTYRDANTPTVKEKFNNIKTSVTNFFSKKPKKEIENPIYKFNDDEIDG